MPLSRPYAIAAAVGSFSRRSTFRPASCAASFVACRCASSKYAGTVMTAPTRSSPSVSSARCRSVARISADTSTGVFDAGGGHEADHAWRRRRSRRRDACVGVEVVAAAAHQPLDRHDRVARVARRAASSASQPTVAPPSAAIAHDRRQQRAAVLVGQHVGHAVAHRGDERVRRAEVDADREPPLVRRRRHAGFGDLQQRHQATGCADLRGAPTRRRRRSVRRTSSCRTRSLAASTSPSSSSDACDGRRRRGRRRVEFGAQAIDRRDVAARRSRRRAPRAIRAAASGNPAPSACRARRPDRGRAARTGRSRGCSGSRSVR